MMGEGGHGEGDTAAAVMHGPVIIPFLFSVLTPAPFTASLSKHVSGLSSPLVAESTVDTAT